jgi:hypothetical protein
MSEPFDQALEELVPPYDEPRRWDDVLRRALVARTRRRRMVVIAVAAAVTAVVVGAGGAFHREVVDFFSADPAPEPIRIEFAKQGARADFMMGPGHATHEAREVARFPVDGKQQPFWVAPVESGGFCFRWHTMGSCGRLPQQGSAPKIGLGGQEGSYGMNWLVSQVTDPRIHRLELEYADGERVELPFVWVSAPIDAGFTAFQVSEERQRKGRHAVAMTGYDVEGKVVERQELPVKSDPRWEAGADGLPRIADRSKKRTLFDFRDETGAQWTLVVAPAPEEKLCYAFNRGGGCVSPRFPATPPAVIPGGKTIMVCCTIAEGVTRVELFFQDGRRIEVEPVDGFLLYELPSEQYRRGKRLEAIVSRNDSGQEIGRVDVKVDHPGVYPCKPNEELKFEYGQSICP